MLSALVLTALPAHAQTLADPTQPPPESRLLAPGAADAPVVSSGPQLQSILIGARGREVAVIDGQTLRKGDKINGAVLVQIGKNQVVLQQGRAKQVLTLFPDTGTGGKTPVHQR
jgi:MSHA biogenesis protein MshK